MTSLTGKPVSYWLDSTPQTNYPSAINNLSVDVAVIGAGIAGLTAAYLLKKAGKTVAVIEAEKVGAGVSGHTTAKVTSLHQLIYADLIKEIGEEKARLYGESNEAAVKFVARTIEAEGIDCDFSHQNTYTFADTPDKLEKIKAEYEAAKQLGLPASFVTETSLPFAVAGAVEFSNQAQFHVRKYLLHLVGKIAGEGSYILEETRVTDVKEGEVCRVITENGTLEAKDVILTTNLPILDQGLFFAKAYPKRSYIVGAKIDPDRAPKGMFIGIGNDYHSIRTTPYGDGLLLLVGGEGHKVGAESNTADKYRRLEDYALSHFAIDLIDYRWSTQDMVSFDKLPYIGKLTPANNHIYVATGFSLWGMSKGTLSGMILCDLILGKDNPWASLYDSLRATPFVTQESIKQNLDVGMHWIGDRFKGLSSPSVSDLQKGEGKLINHKGEQLAVYRDEVGEIHAVSAVCSHLGCIVNWNDAEKSWDCPCHGGRFTCDGKVIQAPPVKDLAKKAIE